MSYPIELLDRITDIQTIKPITQVKLTRVGVKNLKLNLQITSRKGKLSLIPMIDLFVDLPSDKRGVHLSRDPELMHEILLEEIDTKTNRVEDFCENIAYRLLDKHTYSNKAEVHLRSDYITINKSPQGRTSQEPCKILATATAVRKDSNIVVNRTVGVSVVGFTACPCTQNLLQALAEDRLRKLEYGETDVKKIVENMPLATHTQRTTGTIIMQVSKGLSLDVEDLVEIIENSMSGQTHAVLKRPSEASVVIAAHEKTRFTEDVVREILNKLAKKYSNFPGDTRIIVQAHSLESVHKHDIIAERISTLEEILNEISINSS
ncbi:GTP cyclohydrolase MptA [[Eubacterium] cellulosolvens]